MERWVNWSECDAVGILFYPNVFQWFDETAEEFFRSLGLDWHEYFPREGLLGVPIVEAQCRFVSPMPHGERVKVNLSLIEVSRKSFKLLYEVRRGEALCAEGYEVRVFAERQSENGNIRALPIPETIKTRLMGGDT